MSTAPDAAGSAGPTSTLVLARHAQTVWHADNRYAGADSDVDLTATGREQAGRLARWATHHRPEAVVSSPVRRAVETAREAARACGRPLEVVSDLREVGFGVAEGRTLAELERDDPEAVRRFRLDPVAHPFAGAEPPLAAAERCAGALRSLAGRHPGDTVLVVAHNTVLRLALCRLLGVGVQRYRQLFPRLDNAAVSELRVAADVSEPASLLSLNAALPP